MTNNVFELLSFEDPHAEMQKSVLIAQMLNHLRVTRLSVPRAAAQLGIPLEELVTLLACAHQDLTVAQVQQCADAVVSLRRRRFPPRPRSSEYWRRGL